MSQPATSAESSSPLLVAVAWMVGTLISFTLMAIAVRELVGAIHVFEIQFFRSVGALIILAPFALAKGRAALKTAQPKLQIVRNTVHFAAQLGWIAGVALLPLSEVFAIEFTTPIWTALIAALVLSERLNRGRIVALVLGFLGILVILRPGVATIEPGAFFVLGAAVGFAITLVATKALTKTDSAMTILLYMSLIQFPIGAVMAVPVWTTPDPLQMFWLLVVGAVGLSAHFCTARALALADASIVIPMDFMRLPLIVLVGFLLYEESAELFVLLGAVMIFAGNYYSIRREHRQRGTAAS
ncbi:MAG: DMT family transporter [Alphaproteobacteria bacterium]|nr:DMT family transporter [Alphaproteobacteria bacterium]MCZ6591977.1 DMT family transporter [Alphaproteobacteria bacterium]